jgi:hypothetical protein
MASERLRAGEREVYRARRFARRMCFAIRVANAVHDHDMAIDERPPPPRGLATLRGPDPCRRPMQRCGPSPARRTAAFTAGSRPGQGPRKAARESRRGSAGAARLIMPLTVPQTLRRTRRPDERRPVPQRSRPARPYPNRRVATPWDQRPNGPAAGRDMASAGPGRSWCGYCWRGRRAISTSRGDIGQVDPWVAPGGPAPPPTWPPGGWGVGIL